MYVVGLTGGIGSGKSTVADYFQQHGAEVIDADQVARDVVAVGQPALTTIRDYFGADVIAASGELDRVWLRDRIFADAEAKLWLENLVHPLVAREIERRIETADSPYVVLVSPLLVETGRAKRCDRVLVVDLPEDLQRARAAARDQSQTEAIQKIIDSQATRRERLAAADDVIDNSGDIERLRDQVTRLHERYLELAATEKRED